MSRDFCRQSHFKYLLAFFAKPSTPRQQFGSTKPSTQTQTTYACNKQFSYPNNGPQITAAPTNLTNNSMKTNLQKPLNTSGSFVKPPTPGLSSDWRELMTSVDYMGLSDWERDKHIYLYVSERDVWSIIGD